MLAQLRKVIELEDQGWVLNDKRETDRVVSDVPVKMRNLRRDLVLVYPNGYVRPVENEYSLASSEDYTLGGKFKMASIVRGQEYLRDVMIRVFGRSE